MRVLVTGATGFIGRHCVVALLQRGCEVHALSRQAAPRGDARIIWHQGDVLQEKDVARVCEAARATHLLHSAWDVTGGYWNAEGNLDWVSRSLMLLRAAQRHGLQRSVGIGTCAEYGTEHETCDEYTTITQPQGAYACTKLATRWLFQAAGESLGISTAWARLFFPYGPGDGPGKLIPYAISQLSAGKPAEFTSGEQVRDLLFAPDAGDAIAALLLSEVTGPVNIASGCGIAVRDVILRLGAIMERPDLILLGARKSHGLEARRWVAAVHRLTHEAGWLPATSLDDGLRSTISAARPEPVLPQRGNTRPNS